MPTLKRTPPGVGPPYGGPHTPPLPPAEQIAADDTLAVPGLGAHQSGPGADRESERSLSADPSDEYLADDEREIREMLQVILEAVTEPSCYHTARLREIAFNYLHKPLPSENDERPLWLQQRPALIGSVLVLIDKWEIRHCEDDPGRRPPIQHRWEQLMHELAVQLAAQVTRDYGDRLPE